VKYVIQMGSVVIIYVHTKFHKDWFRHSKFNREDTQTHRQHGDCINLIFFLQNKVGRLKVCISVSWND
jgi:hypothetical protein